MVGITWQLTLRVVAGILCHCVELLAAPQDWGGKIGVQDLRLFPEPERAPSLSVVVE